MVLNTVLTFMMEEKSHIGRSTFQRQKNKMRENTPDRGLQWQHSGVRELRV